MNESSRIPTIIVSTFLASALCLAPQNVQAKNSETEKVVQCASEEACLKALKIKKPNFTLAAPGFFFTLLANTPAVDPSSKK